MTNQWPATPSLQWTNGGASSNHLPAVAEPQRLESIQARLHPLDTALSNSEPLPSVRQLLAATPSPSTAGDQLSGSSIQRRWDPMVQSPASDRSSAISGRAALSDILSGKAQASPRNPFATFHNTAQYISPTSDTDRQQSAPLRQRSPPQQLHNLQSAQYPSFLKREAAPIEPMHETAPMFKNPFPEAPIHLRLSNSISPQYTPSPQAQPSVLQPGLPSHGPYYGSSGSWSQQPDISTGRGYNQQIPVSQAGSQSIFSNPELIDTSRPGPAIQVDDRFLPRFLREEYLPDEGLCYFYDDGRHCKAVINSERVNPYWGVTKAGKPRKRLILACRSCRDKKIKCQPDYPKCEQCNKFGRECRFTTVPRRNQTSVATASQPVSPEQVPPARLSSIERSARSSGQPSPQQPSPHQTSWLDPPSPKSAETPIYTFPPSTPAAPDFGHFKIPTSASDLMPVINEKRRASFEIDREELLPGDPLPKGTSGNPPAKRRRTSSRLTLDFEIQESHEQDGDTRSSSDGFHMPHSLTPVRKFTWQTNPLDVDTGLVLDLMNMYFKYFNSSSYSIFPRQPFMTWLVSKNKKSLDDLMLVYAMLAIATRFASLPNSSSVGAEFESIARNAVDSNQGKFTMQLIQARILLGLYASAADNAHGAWDYIGAAIHAAMGVRLFLEEGRSDLGDDYVEFGLNKSAMDEVCRRTFWTLYIMDRFNGYVSGSTSSIIDEDVGLRLPCSEDDFEAQNVTEMPYFEPDFADSPNQPVITSPMGCLVNIVSLWGQYLASICRSARRNDGTFARRYEAMYANMNRNLSAWQSRLPSYFQDSEDSMLRAFEAGHLGTFATIQFVYRTIHIKLNCLAPQECMSHTRIVENLQRARSHAIQLLETCERFNELPVTRPNGPFNISTSFAGYAITTACDVIAARGLKSQLSEALHLIGAGLDCLGNLKGRWRSCEKLQSYVSQRLQVLKLTVTDLSAHDFSDPTSGKPSGADLSQQFFRSNLPGMKTFAPIDDLTYTAGDEAFLEALRGTKSETVHSKPERSILGPMLMF